MLQLLALLFALLLASGAAELPARNAAPYPASGWRPSRPFNLPAADYLPPSELEPQQRQPQRQLGGRAHAYDIELRKERIDFAGQVQDNALVHRNQPQNEYLPPADDDYQQVQQDLPQFTAPPPQQQFVPPQQQQFVPPQQQQFVPPQQQQFVPPQQQRPEQPQRRPLDFDGASAPPQEFGARLQPRPSTQQQASIPRPTQQYGAPEVGDDDLPEPRRLQADISEVNEQQQENRGAIQALNAAVEAYNRERDEDRAEGETDEDEGGYPSSRQSAGSRFTKGQYYVLGPDNKVQRVMFTTSQDEQDARNNGFTAQLKYTPVGEVRDPVFKYNNQGQLVRLFRK